MPAKPPWFRGVDALHAQMRRLQREHPDLVRVEDIGNAAQLLPGGGHRDLLALRLTAGVGDPSRAQRPKALYLAGAHAREVANPELLVRFASDLVARYGHDAAATALLDSRELLLVPVVNPDGHVQVERGYAARDPDRIWWRTSTGADGAHGVDLNRNYDAHWQASTGDARIPGTANYRGTSPASEPEVQAVQRFALRERPGIVLDWHSRGERILFPWGWTARPTRDAAALRTLANRFAALDGYRVEASRDFHVDPAGGTAKDWAYERLHVPAFTIETGTTDHQTAAQFADTERRARPVLVLAAQLAANPWGAAAQPLRDATRGASGTP